MKKHVLIHATGRCDSKSKLGRFFATLTYNNQSKYVTGDLANTTADKCIITGVIEAVNLVREACNLSISIPTKLAFDDFGYPSESNIQIKTCLVNLIAEKKCSYAIEKWKAGGSSLRLEIDRIAHNAERIEPSLLDWASMDFTAVPVEIESEAACPPGTVRLTKRVFDLAVSSNGGFNAEQLSLLGLDHNPIKGWKRRLIGSLISQEVADEFIALKDKHLTGKRRRKSKLKPFYVTVEDSLTWRE